MGFSAPTIRVEDWLEHWLTEVLPGTVRPSTLALYTSITRNHLIPGLGRLWLNKLSQQDIRTFLRGKQSARRLSAAKHGAPKTLSPRTVQYLHTVLRRALEQACQEDVLARNVAKLVPAPSAPAKRVDPIDGNDARRLLETARGDRLYAAYVVALTLRLRRGELLALRWSAIDFDKNVMHIVSNLQRINGTLHFGPPKAGDRTIPLPAITCTALQDHLERQRQDRKEVKTWAEPDLVFTTNTGRPIEPRNFYRSFQGLCRRASVREIGPHGLRHACATLLGEMGTDPRVISEILGHTDPGFTLRVYRHVLPLSTRDAASRMDAMFGGNAGDTTGNRKEGGDHA